MINAGSRECSRDSGGIGGRSAAAGGGSCGERDGEAVLEHLEAGDEAGADGEDDGEAGFDEPAGGFVEAAGGFEGGGEGAKDDGALVAGEDVVDLEAKAFGEGAHVADEVGGGYAAFAVADPGERADVAGNFEVEGMAEELEIG